MNPLTQRKFRPGRWTVLLLAVLCFLSTGRAANVGPGGYTNDFTSWPVAADWATLSIRGGAGDTYDLDEDVSTNAMYSAAAVNFQTVSNVNILPAQLTNATWSFPGGFVQTRPNSSRATALMGTFVNTSGTNATEIRIAYQLQMAGALAIEDAGKGTHVYYSLTGLAGSWVPLPTLNNLTNTGTFALSTNLAIAWPDGASLFILWADDNSAIGTDAANQIDNFSLAVTLGVQPTLAVNLSAPTNGALILSAPVIAASSVVTYGTPPHSVEYFISAGGGSFTSAGSSATPPFTVNLNALAAGDYQLYAIVTDSSGVPASARSATNAFTVVDPINVQLTSPANDATIENNINILGTAAITGGTAPFSVQFFLDGTSNGPAITTPPYTRDFGALTIGDHTVRATVTDARGWVSNSPLHTIHITGPLSVAITPTNGASIPFGQDLILQSQPLGGNAPYSIQFFTNGTPAGTVTTPPYQLNLGAAPVGNYAAHAIATDASAPTPQVANSTTNTITIAPNPIIATLTAPIPNQIVTAGQNFNLTASATVFAPFAVTNVQFFLDGSPVGNDATAPYSATVVPALGAHTAYALATDNAGRQAYTATNTFTATTPPSAAVVGPTGYTNDFATQPTATDWATASITGGAGDNYTMDTEVNTAINQLNVTNRVASAPGNPPNAAATAVWASEGFYLQTRPTGNRYNALLARFLNQSGTNATQITINYQLTTAPAGGAEETGTRGYYSLTGLPGTWTNVPAFNNNTSTAGSAAVTASLALDWTNGASLYLVWLDDNASGQTTDAGNQIDNFSLNITAGSPPYFAARVLAPTNTQLYLAGTPITAEAAVASGTSPYVVEYFLNAGAGNTTFTSAGTATNAPYPLALGTLPAGDYNIYAVATDSALVTTNSFTNTFRVADPVAFALTAPANGATFDSSTAVQAATTVAGGTPPYAVQFYLDASPVGSPVTSAPYEFNYGPIFVGPHTLHAVATDARGWASNSLSHTIHITGGLGATLLPTNGSTFNYGTSLTLTANVAGGTAPYTATFYVNDQPIPFSGPPFTTNLGFAPPGTYTSYVAAADSDVPPTQVFSTTNIITILENPLAITLNAPTNGQTAVVGLPLALSATATVNSPLTIASVEFFSDGNSIGLDTNAPFTATTTAPGEGDHTFHALATDTLGRTAATAVSTVTYIIDPLANNNFANAIVLGTPASVAGNNTGATTQQGEPANQFGGGVFLQWGATLWYRWTAPFSGTVTIDTYGSAINTVLSVYTGTAVNSLTLVQRNDDAPGQANVSLVSFSAIAGTEYQIQLGGQGGGFGGGTPAQGAFLLNLSMPAFVSITNPAPGTAYTLGTPIPVDVLATSLIGTVTNVSLYRGGAFVGTRETAPYSFIISNAPAGSNALYAVAQDTSGQSSTSAVVRIFVANIGITLTAPQDALIYPNTNPITASVFAAPISGSITSVNFYVNNLFFGTDTTPPFTATWSNVTGGSHRLTATGLDDSGRTYTATPVNFGVAFTLIASNTAWRYLDNGTDQGTNWLLAAFDDSSWSNALAELGYGDDDEATRVEDNATPGYLASDSDRYTTTYFRRTFNVANANAIASLNFALERDDGAVVYLNGREIFRVNLPAAPTVITYQTLAPSSVEDTTDFFTASPTNLVTGTNYLAVEIHQNAANSSDISFNLDLRAAPVIIYNLLPAIALTTPTNTQYFLAPGSVPLAATASDEDGSVTNVAFFVDGVKLGDDATAPYEFTWNSPTVAAHTVTAVATDDLGASSVSTTANIVIYNGAGTPVAAIIDPANGAVMEGPTNLLISATANAITGVTNVEFLANGVLFGADATAPYSAIWSSSFLSNGLQAVAIDANGVRGTSPVVSVTITIPPTNVVAPTIATQIPLAYATITNLTNLTVRFTERVQGVDAADLLINGLPATSVFAAPNGSNYVFAFPHPPYGNVDISFASGHGITDFGFPSNLAFNALAPESIWSYTLIDQTPPRVAAKTPDAGVTVTNLSVIAVSFSENVVGVTAEDLLLNGVPAFGVSGTGSNYVFNVLQPASGTLTVSWATNHNIADFADIPNSFVRTGAGNSWSFVLDSRTTFIQSNSVWQFVKGTAEASDPTNAWRSPAFNVSSWSNSPAPFFYGDPYTNFARGIFGTHLTDMRSNYSSIYLRQEFSVVNRGAVTNLLLNAQSDDGFIAWLNGVEVLRVNVAAGSTPFNGTSIGASQEPGNVGAGYVVYTLTNNAVQHLISGVNVLAVHALNESLGGSSDFGFNAQLYSFLADFAVIAPRVAGAEPAPGDVFYLTNLVVSFSEGVTNVEASDLLVNGVPASSVVSSTNTTYVFSFAQPGYGPVLVSWATNHGIMDLDAVPKAFDGNAVSAQLNYLLVNPSAPIVAARVPIASTTVTGLTSITVTFSEAVAGVTAEDLLINGVAASGLVVNSSSEYVFSFAQPAFGPVAVRFSTNTGIVDVEAGLAFDWTRPANQWSYALVNPVPSVALTAPVDNAYVLVGANVTLSATASDNDGVIASVEFYEFGEGISIGTDTVAPFSVTWSNVALGSYQLRAIATDNTGLSATSAPVVLNVVTALPIALLRGPYLVSGSPTGGVVRWRTDMFSDGVVRYGTDRNFLTNVAVEATLTNNHVVRLGGLEPDTKYYYAFGSSAFTLGGGTNSTGSNYWFNTSPLAGTPKPTRLWVLGDPGTANNNQRAVRDAFNNFAATNGRLTDLWLMLGDNAYNNGTDTEYQAAVFDMYPTTLRNHFLWPVIGNHEVSAGSPGGTASTFNSHFPYLDMFNTPRNGEAGGVPSGTPKYYSLDYGNIHLVGLDSMTSSHDTNGPMAEWLKSDLAANTQTWVIVYFHHPPYTKGSHNSDTETDLIRFRQNFNPIFEAYNVDLVLAGHSHCYERSYLLNGHYGLSTTFNINTMTAGGESNGAGNGREDGGGAYVKSDDVFGTIYSVAGSAGQATGGQLNHPAHFSSLNELGSAIIDISSNRLDMFFLNSSGEKRDYFTIIKRSGSKPLSPADLVAHAIGTNAIQLTWSDVATNEFGYYIDRSVDGTNFVRIGTNSVDTTSFLDSGLAAGVTFYYRVVAYNGVGESGGSEASSFTGNNAPSLAVIPDFIAEVLRPVFFVAGGVDTDLPANVLTYSLEAGAPAGAVIHGAKGQFMWRPLRSDADTTNTITVRVADDGVPALSATRTFTVVVRDYIELGLGGAVLEPGQATNLTIELVSSAPLANLSFNVLLPLDRLTSLTMDNLVPATASASLSFSLTDAVTVNFAALTGQTLSGTQQLARLNFVAAPGQTSAFIPLHFDSVTGQRSQPGLAPSVLAHEGRVVVVGSQPLLEANIGNLGARTLTLYGKPGTNYIIETSSNPANPGSWTTWTNRTPASLQELLPAPTGTSTIFYRARQSP
jgi:hypothetical protein